MNQIGSLANAQAESLRTFDDVVFHRRTSRRYLPERLSSEVYETLISAAVQAPSACNRQAWKFIVVDDRELLRWLFEQGGASFLDHVHQGILVLYCNRTDNTAYGDPIQSAAAATTILQLKASEMGIGSCWVCHLPPKREIRRRFRIPAYYDPMAFVTLGYCQREPFRRPRKADVATVLSYNRFDFTDPPMPQIDWGMWCRRWGRRLYYLFPWRRGLYPWARKYEKKFYD